MKAHHIYLFAWPLNAWHVFEGVKNAVRTYGAQVYLEIAMEAFRASRDIHGAVCRYAAVKHVEACRRRCQILNDQLLTAAGQGHA